MARKLFCELNSLTYKISVAKGILKRRIQWMRNRHTFATRFDTDTLPIKIYDHKSLIRRKLGNVDMELQENKAINLSLAAPKINGIIIRPGEVFSFWRLVGKCTKFKGFKEGLVIRSGTVSQGVGGGMCQFSNLIHWLILHSPLTITEHHHHNDIDMFPDYGRQIPFGTGTSIMYNYLDYQFVNNTEQTFQLVTYVTDEYLCGELRSDRKLKHAYHIEEENSFFAQEDDGFYRNNEIYRKKVDKRTGNQLEKELILRNHSKVLYDAQYIPIDRIKAN